MKSIRVWKTRKTLPFCSSLHCFYFSDPKDLIHETLVSSNLIPTQAGPELTEWQLKQFLLVHPFTLVLGKWHTAFVVRISANGQSLPPTYFLLNLCWKTVSNNNCSLLKTGAEIRTWFLIISPETGGNNRKYWKWTVGWCTGWKFVLTFLVIHSKVIFTIRM